MSTRVWAIFSTAIFLLMDLNQLLGDGNKVSVDPTPEVPTLDQSLYVVTQNRYAEGYQANSAKFSDLIMIEIIPSGSTSIKQKSYEVGKKYQVLSGGELQGSVMVDKIVDLQCDSTAAVVELGPSTKIPKDGFVLATNSKIAKSHKSTVSAPSEMEKRQVLDLVSEEFKKRNIYVKNSDIKTEDIRATRLLPDSTNSIIGSFSVKSATSLDRVFIIANPSVQGFKPALVKYGHCVDLQDGKDDESENFVDQLDLAGDGNEEVVTQVTGYEYESFRVYKRTENGWIKVLIGGVGGC